MTFRVTIKIWGWVQKYHPECRFFIENGVFDDMKEDWAEVCDALQRTCVDKIPATRSWGGVGGANIKNPATPLAPQT